MKPRSYGRKGHWYFFRWLTMSWLAMLIIVLALNTGCATELEAEINP